MAIKKLVWEFDKKGSCIKVDMAHSKEYTKTDPEARFVFTLARYRNEKTELEYLGISCNHGDIGHGEIFTSYSNLSTDLKKFKDYGVALSDLVYMNLQKRLRNHIYI